MGGDSCNTNFILKNFYLITVKLFLWYKKYTKLLRLYTNGTLESCLKATEKIKTISHSNSGPSYYLSVLIFLITLGYFL